MTRVGQLLVLLLTVAMVGILTVRAEEEEWVVERGLDSGKLSEDGLVAMVKREVEKALNKRMFAAKREEETYPSQ